MYERNERVAAIAKYLAFPRFFSNRSGRDRAGAYRGRRRLLQRCPREREGGGLPLNLQPRRGFRRLDTGVPFEAQRGCGLVSCGSSG